MNIAEYRKLGEALGWTDSPFGWQYMTDDQRDAMEAAARRDHDRWQECDCDDGTGNCDCGACDLIPGQSGYVSCSSFKPCPSCGGSGLQPNQAKEMS